MSANNFQSTNSPSVSACPVQIHGPLCSAIMRLTILHQVPLPPKLPLALANRKETLAGDWRTR